MSESPIVQTLKEMLEKLVAATTMRNEAQKQITEYTVAIRALAQVCEDGETKDFYIERLDELSGKPGFMETIRSVLRFRKEGLTPTEIRSFIKLHGKMDLSAYSNPLASIHTTLRRMKEATNPEIEEFQKNGEKAYRLIKQGIEPPPTTGSVRKYRKI